MDPKDVLGLLEKNGLRGAIVPYHRVEEVKAEIGTLLKDGLLDEEFYNESISLYFDEKLPRAIPRPKSILIVAAPDPQRRVTFYHGGEAFKFVVPPTYGTGAQVTRRIRSILEDGQRGAPFKLVNASPPLKLLSVRSGVTMYGRNNITYSPGFGSFQRLTAFYSDLDPPEGYWGEKRTLPKCAKCRACVSACPTAAISEDRFLLRAELCLTCMNEKTSEHAFPSWVKPEWHNAIIGCMICQRVCPYNKEFAGEFEEGESFSEEETEYLLKGKYSDKKATLLSKKLKRAGLDISIFPRNLETLLGRPKSK